MYIAYTANKVTCLKWLQTGKQSNTYVSRLLLVLIYTVCQTPLRRAHSIKTMSFQRTCSINVVMTLLIERPWIWMKHVTSFQRWFDVLEYESTLKWCCFDVDLSSSNMNQCWNDIVSTVCACWIWSMWHLRITKKMSTFYHRMLVRSLTWILGVRMYNSPYYTASTRNIRTSTYKWGSARQNLQNGICAQERLTSAWASAQSDQSLRCVLNR